MFRTPKAKLTLPKNANPLPWSVVFLILFLSISCISMCMSMIDSWRDQATAAPTERPLLDTDAPSTEAPLEPVIVKRRYTIGTAPARPLEYLFSDSKLTR